MSESFDPADLNRRDMERFKSYRELLDFYHGIQWESRERRGEKRLTFNYAKVFVDKVTSYLMTGVNFSVEPVENSDEASARARRAEEALYQVYEENNLEQLDFETEIDCAILGDACYKVIWDSEIKNVKITAPDIQGIYTWWIGDNTSEVWQVASKYSLTSETVSDLYGVKSKAKTASVIEVWTVRDYEIWVDGIKVEKNLILMVLFLS
jgi:hypothetical protein